MAPKEPRFAWPAIPILTADEVYAKDTPQAKEYALWLEENMRFEKAWGKPENLDGLRVLDLTTSQMIGHWCTSLLAEQGAEVIQVEPPGGDPARQLTPFGRQEYMFEDKVKGEPVGGTFLHEMRNKQSITLNLETEEGRDVLRRLAVHADVIVENMAPGRADELGIGYRQLSQINPRLVYCWVGQRGQWGPLKDKPGMLDPVAQCACGFVHGTGTPKEMGGRPTRSAMWMADYVGGTSAAIGILSAVFYRNTVSGQGQFVEATGAEAVIRILDYSWAWYGMDGSIRPRYGNWDLAINIYSVNPAKDGYMMIGGGHDRLWYRIWNTVGKDRPDVQKMIVDDPNLKEVTDRLTHAANVKACTLLSEWMKDKTRFQAESALLEEQVASGAVTTIDEVAEYPHFKYRGHLAEIDDQFYGKVLYATSPFLQKECAPRVKWMGRSVGFDNNDVYRRLLGFTKAEMDRMQREGVI